MLNWITLDNTTINNAASTIALPAFTNPFTIYIN